MDLLHGAGIVDLPEPKRIHVVREPIGISDNDASIVAMPAESGLTVTYSLNYPNTAIGQQHFTLEVDDDTYTRMISPARTFCLQSEAEALLQQGLGKGASYQTTVVWGPNGPIERFGRPGFTLSFIDGNRMWYWAVGTESLTS